jgi:hypothetical protein
VPEYRPWYCEVSESRYTVPSPRSVSISNWHGVDRPRNHWWGLLSGGSRIMLLGRDFGLHSYYVRRSKIANADETMYTWRRTVDCALQPLVGVGVWAVNYLIGARLSGPATGDLRASVPSGEWEAYEDFCWHFLCNAALLQRPRYIVVYGANNTRDLQRVGRLQGPRYTFRYAAEEHAAEILFAPHPSSLRSRVSQERAREWYRQLAISIRAEEGALRT